MKVKTLKLRKAKYPKTSQGLVVHYLIHRWGSYTRLGKLIGESKQNLYLWKMEEEVPLVNVGPVSRILSVPIESLNYSQVADLLGSVPPWDSVVKKLNFTIGVRNEILSSTWPSVPSDVIVIGQLSQGWADSSSSAL